VPLPKLTQGCRVSWASTVYPAASAASCRVSICELKAQWTCCVGLRLCSWAAPLDTQDQGRVYLTNENFHELVMGSTLGKGNYGIVQKADWRGRTVAVKKVGPSFRRQLLLYASERPPLITVPARPQMILPNNLQPAQQAQLVEDFKCEVDICCRLKHPRLVDFIGYCTSPDLCLVQVGSVLLGTGRGGEGGASSIA
jgi:hypothetical protein